MKYHAFRGEILWALATVATVVLFVGVMVEATRVVNCSVALHNADCDREAVAVFAANGNGAVFDRINVLAGRSALIDQFMEDGARYGLFVIVGVVGLSWFLRNGADRDRRLAVYTAVLSAAISLSVASVIQHVYVHQRPFVLRSDVVLLIPHGADPSFPSEHATAAFALAAGVALFRSRVGLIVLALAAFVAVSRIYVGLHYPADVGAGALIGICAASVVWSVRRQLAWLDGHVVLRFLPRRLA